MHLDELTGFLQFTSQVIPTSRAFLRNLYDFSKGFTSRFTQRGIPGAAKKDIDWWRTVAVGWNGIRFVSPSRDVVHIFTNAAGTKGLGGHFGRQCPCICIAARRSSDLCSSALCSLLIARPTSAGVFATKTPTEIVPNADFSSALEESVRLTLVAFPRQIPKHMPSKRSNRIGPKAPENVIRVATLRVFGTKLSTPPSLSLLW
ncbi:hypothetical protein D9611_014282 [Ephemerocybe angulata]|uniref:Uncharacterized protein n=1 Tax=Ephemerocybe angulata TaxID=980116 RepID=A0A8H5BVF2_9AGAR|nr:hypothetical protein D9611_014282 [Tulosesus angulatus]